LIISELCFAKQYPCCAPAKNLLVRSNIGTCEAKKIPRTSTRD
jgi:hypothetical protein